MKELLASLIKPLGDMCYRLVNSVGTSAALAVNIVVLVLLILWVITLKGEKKRVRRKGFHPLRQDLRTWAVLILVIQIAFISVQFLPLKPAKTGLETGDIAADMKVLEGNIGDMFLFYLMEQADELKVNENEIMEKGMADARDVLGLDLEKIVAELEPERQRFWRESSDADRIEKIRELIGFRSDHLDYRMKRTGGFQRDGYRIEKLKLIRTNELPIPSLLFVPDNIEGKAPAAICLDGRGKQAEAGLGGAYAEQAKGGRIVLAIDVRGFGETADRPCWPDDEAGLSMRTDSYIHIQALSAALGRPLLGQRVEEVVIALNMLCKWMDVDRTDIRIQASGGLETVALHAAAIDERISSIELPDAIKSWLDNAKMPQKQARLLNLPPSCLRYYDVDDLYRLVESRTAKKGR